MFEKGRIGIFGDSLTQVGDNVNDINKPMVWSQMLKLLHPEYEFVVDAIGGRKMWGTEFSNNGKKRDGSSQLEPFIRNSFPCNKIIIFLGTNDIFGGLDDPAIGLRDLKSFEKALIKFKNYLFELLDELYQEKYPEIIFVTTHKFNFKNNSLVSKNKFIDFKDYDQISNIFKQMNKINIIDISQFISNDPDGIHFSMEQQKDFYKIIEKNIF